MSEWKEYKLEEVTEPIKDTFNPDGSDDYAYIGLEHIEQETLRLNSVGVSSDVTSNKFLFKPNDVLFGKLRPYFRKVVKPKFDGICSTDIWVFRAKEGFDQNYLYYFIANWDFVNTANSGEGGTRMPRADWNFLKTTEWSFPLIPEQIQIASILSSIDDKIDLLHRQNKTLEQLAETLFRQWFVIEAKEDWERKPLGDYVQIKRGGSPRPIHDYISEAGLNWLKISDVTSIDSPYIFEIKEKIKKEGLNKTTLLKKGSLILSNSATPGIPKILDVDSCIHDGWLHFPKSKFSKEFLYLFFKHIKPELLQLGNGSIFTNLKTDILKEYVLPIADDKSLAEFDEQIKTIFEKLYTNTIQIRTLAKLRDTLLPKLMSGEVRVEN